MLERSILFVVLHCNQCALLCTDLARLILCRVLAAGRNEACARLGRLQLVHHMFSVQFIVESNISDRVVMAVKS